MKRYTTPRELAARALCRLNIYRRIRCLSIAQCGCHSLIRLMLFCKPPLLPKNGERLRQGG